jgi:uncharacterized 2Fe-2S/4Fe-4S cluster protein (DUF4445 family)
MNGMRARSGAIERVRISGNQIRLKTIGEVEPIGICGSGMLDLLAELKKEGVMESSGRLLDHPLTDLRQGVREIVLTGRETQSNGPRIAITQKDIRQVQLAKAAIRAGIALLLESQDCHESKIEQVIVGGAFGSHIDLERGVMIGMLPSLPLSRFVQVGNSAGIGARMVLLSVKMRDEAAKIAEQVRYMELAAVSDFSKLLTKATIIDSKLKL